MTRPSSSFVAARRGRRISSAARPVARWGSDDEQRPAAERGVDVPGVRRLQRHGRADELISGSGTLVPPERCPMKIVTVHGVLDEGPLIEATILLVHPRSGPSHFPSGGGCVLRLPGGGATSAGGGGGRVPRVVD